MVEVATVPKFVDLQPEIREKLGDQMKLECKVQAQPTATIEWYRGGRPLGAAAENIIFR
jgi:hypothetical protein